MCLLVMLPMGMASAKIQTLESNIGTVQIDFPYTAEPGQGSGGNFLNLIKPGTTKPIITIYISEAALFKDFQDFAESSIGPGHLFEKMATDDGKHMLFNVYQDGTDKYGNPEYTYRGYIDYSKENGKYIIMHAPNEVRYDGDVIATYTKDQFAAVCRSFTVK